MSNKSTYTRKSAFWILMLLVISSVLFGAPNPNNIAVKANTQSGCPITIDNPAEVMSLAYNSQITFSTFSVDAGNNALITVTNNTNCQFPLSLAAYKVYDQQPNTQELYDSQNKVVPPQDSRSLLVDLPSCMSQIDLLHDPNQDGPPEPPTPANPKLIGWTFQYNKHDIPSENDMFHFEEGHPYSDLDRFPNDDDDGFANVPEENRCSNVPPLQAECSVSPDPAEIDEAVTWSTDVSGGNGVYDYTWSGDASGDTKNVTETYTAEGTKQATVTVKSGDQERTPQCDVSVQENDDDDDGDGNNGQFSMSITDPFAWLVSNSPLRSTKSTLNLSKSNNFDQEVTLTATSPNTIDNEDTMFVYNNGSPQEQITLQPTDFAKPLQIYVRDSITHGTYPITVTAQSASGKTKQSSLTLRVRSIMEF